MNEFLTKLLVQLWDKFKAKNAKVATIIVVLLGGLLYVVDSGVVNGLIQLPEWATSAIKFIATFLLAVQGSRTTADLQQLQDKESQ
jgi:hypothetical protein